MTFDRARFVKFVGLLGSDHAGEVTNAARMATAMLKAAGMTWADVIMADPKPAPPRGARPEPPPRQEPDGVWHPTFTAGGFGFVRRSAERDRRQQQTTRERADAAAANAWRGAHHFGVDMGKAEEDRVGFAWMDPDGMVRVHSFARQQGKTWRQSIEAELRAAGYSEDVINRALDAAGV